MRSASRVTAIVGAALVITTGVVRSVSAAPPDPCAVLTTAQVSEALGVPVAEGKHLATALCEWAPVDAAAAKGKRLDVSFQDRRAFDYAKTPVPGTTITKVPVTGIGDEAVLGTTKNVGTGLTVRKGDVVFNVFLRGLPDDQTAAKEKALALEILHKI